MIVTKIDDVYAGGLPPTCKPFSIVTSWVTLGLTGIATTARCAGLRGYMPKLFSGWSCRPLRSRLS